MEKFEFKPMQWVLARNTNTEWTLCQFSHMSRDVLYVMCGGSFFPYCIPYQGNKSLRGTKEDYVEPYEPKNGDFIAFGDLEGDKRALQIFKSFIDDGSHDAYVTLPICLDIRDYAEKVDMGYNFGYNNINIRPTTEEEKNLLLSKLHEIGKDWDAEKKEIVDWEWEPSEGECFYYPIFRNGEFVSISGVWENEDKDSLSLLSKGYVFRTDEECTYLCNRLNESIKNVK